MCHVMTLTIAEFRATTDADLHPLVALGDTMVGCELGFRVISSLTGPSSPLTRGAAVPAQNS